MKNPFARKRNDQDFSHYLDGAPQSRKQRLLAECQKHDISPHIDNRYETSSGVYAELRGVASEAELEQRLNAKKAIGRSNRANLIAFLALVASVVALVKSFL